MNVQLGLLGMSCIECWQFSNILVYFHHLTWLIPEKLKLYTELQAQKPKDKNQFKWIITVTVN
jgi:hypothetical protein